MRVFAALILGVLTACAAPLEMSVEERAEQTAAAAVAVLQPESDPAPVANCVRDLAAFDELIALSNGSADSPDAATVAMVSGILAREDVADCVAFNNVLLAG